MASSWGSSWLASWADSWGAVGGAVVTTTPHVGGLAGRAEEHRKRTESKYKTALSRIDDIIAEFEQKPESPIYQAAAAREVFKLRDEVYSIPIPETPSLTLAQVMEVRAIILLEMQKLWLLNEDEEFLILYASTLII
jgi:hypothetical protein